MSARNCETTIEAAREGWLASGDARSSPGSGNRPMHSPRPKYPLATHTPDCTVESPVFKTWSLVRGRAAPHGPAGKLLQTSHRACYTREVQIVGQHIFGADPPSVDTKPPGPSIRTQAKEPT